MPRQSRDSARAGCRGRTGASGRAGPTDRGRSSPCRAAGSGPPPQTATALVLCALLPGVLAAPPGVLGAQARPDPPPKATIGDTVAVVPGPGYRAGPLRRTLVGRGWRDVWLTPVDAPVFGFDLYAGGVEWTERGGGSQSITLHLKAEGSWREYIFRSVNKFPEQAMPPEVRGTAAGRVLGDLIHAYFPAAPLLVPPFMEATGLLHVKPVLRIMPDDPRLGVYRDTLAGMLGTVEIKPNEAPGDEPGYAGSPKIKGSEEFLNDLESSKVHRLDQREYLKARLVDMLLNDMDRSRDNFRWARFGTEGDYRWRPLPVDRDWAFVDADGWLPSLVRTVYPKFVALEPDLPPIEALTYGSFVLDRRLLQRLGREDFREVAASVQAAITDDVIEASIAEMPERWLRETDAPDRLRSTLPARRDALGDAAEELYDWLATDVDLHGTDESDDVHVRRFEDGRVRVEIRWPEGSARAGEIHYARTFLPDETDEVRVHLHGGDDTARVAGHRSDAIVVRLVGGGGDDVLVDSVGGPTHLYDARGDNRLVVASGTRVSRRAWNAPEPQEGFRLASAWAPDWGATRGWSASVAYGEPTGAVVGFGPTWTTYGFRRLPYHRAVGVRGLLDVGDRRFGAEMTWDHRMENSPLALTLLARATTFQDFRFAGWGNDTPSLGEAAVVEQTRIEVRPALVWRVGWRARETEATLPGQGDGAEEQGDDATARRSLRPLVGRIDLGPVFLWSDPDPPPGSPLAAAGAPGARDGLAHGGVRADAEVDRTDRDALPRRGWRARGSAGAYVVPDGRTAGFSDASAEVRGYVPLAGDGPHLALRLGGTHTMGDVPVQHSAWIGGRTNLRGYRWQRFRGEAAAWGSAELRVPVAPVELLWRWNLGVLALADAGRVWVDGDSPGGWHVGKGGGVWLEAFGHRLRAAWAHGEEGRLHLDLGVPF